MTRPTTRTRTIAGWSITLQAGKRYLATRPMARALAHNQKFPITIENEANRPVAIIPTVSYAEANAFLAEFNNGDISFDGRVW